MILNLPGDEMDDSIETAKILSALPVQIVKAHSLYIAKDTRLCDDYENGTISLCKKEEYLNRLILFLPVPIRRTASYRSVLFMP